MTTLNGHLAAASREAAEVAVLPALVDSPEVSVVVPTHNRRQLVLETLEALARQKAPPFEVVVADDGSTDGSFEAVLEKGSQLGLAGKAVRLRRNGGPATARNVALLTTRADLIAFTDSDCLPIPEWIQVGLASFRPGIGIVQGRTQPPPGSQPSFFSHFIEMDRLDGSFSTCNAFYRREAVLDAGGFDPSCRDWEDRDLGWRVLRLGWKAVYAPDAAVHHQIIPQSPLEWMRWPAQLGNWPHWVARYPESRRALFARYWANRDHALLTAGIVGLALAPALWPAGVLAVPYLLSLPARYQYRGKWAPVKALLHVWWDLFGWACLAVSSVRRRTLVL